MTTRSHHSTQRSGSLPGGAVLATNSQYTHHGIFRRGVRDCSCSMMRAALKHGFNAPSNIVNSPTAAGAKTSDQNMFLRWTIHATLKLSNVRYHEIPPRSIEGLTNNLPSLFHRVCGSDCPPMAPLLHSTKLPIFLSCSRIVCSLLK